MTNLQIVVPAELLAQQSSITETLAGIANEQAKLSAQQQEAEAAQLRIASAVAFLRGEPIPQAAKVSTRRPMSQAGRDKIAAGWALRRANKANAEAVAPVTEPLSPAPVGDVKAAAPKAAKAK
jgi:hypothetical protein